MNTDEKIRLSMGRMARDIRPTVPDPAAIRARAVRNNRVRTVAAIGLAAAVTGAVIGGVVILRDHTEATPPTNPNGIEVVDTAVWMVDGVVHVGDQAYPQDKAIQTALAPVQDGVVYGAAGGTVVYQPLRGPAEVIATDAAFGPAADPDSGLVAWLAWSEADGRYDLWLYDIERGSDIWAGPVMARLGGQDNPFGDSPLTPIEWVGANPEGGYTMLYTAEDGGPRRYDARDNGSGTTREIGSAAYDMTLGLFAEADQDTKVVTFVSEEGSDLASADGLGADGGGLSHDGAYFAGLDAGGGAGAIAVANTQTGEIRYLDAPDGTPPSQLSWAAGHTLMFLAPDADSQSTSGRVVACDADTLQCANVADVDDITAVTLPTL